ncbi:sensor histidine kinase [Flavisolibacter nicotianae]|uniref:sensor histidine kinase n=1 Tax=Flavisolibacter nicotianae TaxID=2364882 RepID=UPI000EABE095|nr:histidine kinase [Flavisolibacter nicotianae]
MKKIGLHLAFWSLYFVQDVLLIFFVNLTRLPKPTPIDFAFAAVNCLVILLPKLLFTYFVLWVLLKQLASRADYKRGIVTAVFALLFTIFLYRTLVVYVVNPFIYHWNDGHTIFYPLGLLVALMDIGFVSGAAIVIKQVRLQAAAREREKSLVREKLEAELKFLRNQTNPHFLFNTLNNIYALARKKSDQTPEVVMKLSKLLRFMLYESAKPLIKIGEEVKILDDYIELEKLRYNSRLTVNFYREIDNSNEEISPLLLLPFVENAFKHGPGESHFDSSIHIELIVQNGSLAFTIENTKEKSGSNGVNENIGLRNVKRQLELMYPGYSLQVNNEDALFSVSLFVNLKAHEKNQLSYSGR